MDRRQFLGIASAAALVTLQEQARGQGQGQSQGRGQAPRPQGHHVIETSAAAREKFNGVYKLVIYQPHGDNPTGRIYYDRAGRMGAMLSPPGRTPLPPSPNVEDYRRFQQGLVAYYGTYSVDESTRRVIHHIEAASNPAWIGTDFVRWYEFNGNRLTLRTSETSTSPLVWERLPDK